MRNDPAAHTNVLGPVWIKDTEICLGYSKKLALATVTGFIGYLLVFYAFSIYQKHRIVKGFYDEFSTSFTFFKGILSQSIDYIRPPTFWISISTIAMLSQNMNG